MKPSVAPSIPKEEREKVTVSEVFHALLPPLILILAVLGSILGGVATPTEAAAVGAVGAILLAGYRLDEKHGKTIIAAAVGLVVALFLSEFMDLRVARDHIEPMDLAAIIVAAICVLLLGLGILTALIRTYRNGVLRTVMEGTTEVTTMVFLILIGASLFSLVFRGLGGEEMIQEALAGMPGGAVGAMIAVMLLMFFLGFFLDFLEIVFVVVPMVAPVLLQMENAEWGYHEPDLAGHHDGGQLADLLPDAAVRICPVLSARCGTRICAHRPDLPWYHSIRLHSGFCPVDPVVFPELTTCCHI